MKKSIKKFLVLALAVLAVSAFGAHTKEVKAANTSVKVKTSKKVNVKNYKLKKKARKSVRTQTTKRTNTRTTTSIAAKVVQVTETKVVKKTKLASKKKQIKTTTTVKVTTKTTSFARTGKASIDQMKGIVDTRVINAYKASGFGIETNADSSILRGADGVFSPSNKAIVLKYNVDRLLAHELGHFVSNQAANTAEFKSIYNAEKGNFDGSADNAYETSSNGEFFAGAFAEYSMNPSHLKSTCPRAYDYVAKTVKSL